jgi:hypothetical protein
MTQGCTTHWERTLSEARVFRNSVKSNRQDNSQQKKTLKARLPTDANRNSGITWSRAVTLLLLWALAERRDYQPFVLTLVLFALTYAATSRPRMTQ